MYAAATLLLVAAVVPVVGGVAGPARADEPDPVVTWSQDTAFDPATTPYTFHIEDTGDGTLYAVWRGSRTEIPHSGDVSLEQLADGHNLSVDIQRCADDGSCVDTGVTSPRLFLYRQLDYTGHSITGSVRSPGPLALQLGLAPVQKGDEVDLSWQVLPADGTTAIATGEEDLTALDGGLVRLATDLPAGLADGHYVLDVVATSDLPDYGTLSTNPGRFAFVVDDTAPALTVSTSSNLLAPHPDHYHDHVDITARTDEAVGYTFTFLDSTGVVVDVRHGPAHARTGRLHWPDYDGGMPRRPGRYTVVVAATDAAGNVSRASVHVRVSSERLALRRWTRTISARAAVASRLVEACSRLSSPDTAGDPGSLGYLSGIRCQDRDKEVVATADTAALPVAPTGRYAEVQVYLNGGAAVGEKAAYLVSNYLTPTGKRVDRAQFRGNDGQHNIGLEQGTSLIHGLGTMHPFLAWQIGLSEGSRYDVRSFTVTTLYLKLVG